MLSFGWKSELVEKGYLLGEIWDKEHMDTLKEIVISIFIILL